MRVFSIVFFVKIFAVEFFCTGITDKQNLISILQISQIYRKNSQKIVSTYGEWALEGSPRFHQRL